MLLIRLSWWFVVGAGARNAWYSASRRQLSRVSSLKPLHTVSEVEHPSTKEAETPDSDSFEELCASLERSGICSGDFPSEKEAPSREESDSILVESSECEVFVATSTPMVPLTPPIQLPYSPIPSLTLASKANCLQSEEEDEFFDASSDFIDSESQSNPTLKKLLLASILFCLGFLPFL